MVIQKRSARCRSGATLVESTFILILLTSVIFGIFEYGRLLMVWNLLNNAAREGCRYALVNNTSSTVVSDTQSLVIGYMAGQDHCFTNFTVTVSTSSGATDTTSINNLVAGNSISVTVSGTYKFMNIVPLVKMPTITISSAVMMMCEGVT